MAGERDIKGDVNRGTAWIGLASTLVTILDIVVLLVILRFFATPAQYGTAMLAAGLFPILDYATDLGISAAIIQRDDYDKRKLSTLFWMNGIMGVVLFGALCLIGPALGRMHDRPVVGTLLIAYGTKLIFQSAYTIPSSLMKRELRFKELSIIRIVANVVEFSVKIGVAAAGEPVWAFVVGPLARIAVTAVGVQLRHRFVPMLVFKPREVADLAKFGLTTSFGQILFYVYTSLDLQVVGFYFGTAAVGLYKAAVELVLEPVKVISYVVIEVAFPAFARLRYRRTQLIEQFIAFTRQNLVVVTPFLALTMLETDAMIRLFFGADFVLAASAARVLAFAALLRSLSYILPPLLNGIGHPLLFLVYASLATVLLPALFSAFAYFLGPTMGYESVAFGWLIGYPIAFAVLAWMALTRIGLPVLTYLRRVIGIPICVAAAALVCAPVAWLIRDLHPGLRLVIITPMFLGLLAVLLARFQGISVRSIAAELKSKPPQPPPDDPPDGQPPVA